jgi:hypothetical protein
MINMVKLLMALVVLVAVSGGMNMDDISQFGDIFGSGFAALVWRRRRSCRAKGSNLRIKAKLTWKKSLLMVLRKK